MSWAQTATLAPASPRAMPLTVKNLSRNVKLLASRAPVHRSSIVPGWGTMAR